MPGVFHTTTLQEIASWPKPNYVDPVERTWLPPYAITLCAVGCVFTAGRIYLRSTKRPSAFGWDDAAIIIACIFSIGLAITACLAVWNYDVGRHVWDVRPVNYVPALKIGWVAQVLFVTSTGATKCSVYLFYLRIFNHTYSRTWIRWTWALFFVTASSWVGLLLTYFCMCTPLSTFWDIHSLVDTGVTNYKCANGDAIIIIMGFFTIGSDFWTAALPCLLFQYHDLGVPRRQRLAMNFVFCLGFLVTVAGVVRTYYLWKIKTDNDISWTGYDLFVSAIIETELAIMCCCAPFLRAVIRIYLPSRSATGTAVTAEGGEDDGALGGGDMRMVRRASSVLRDSFSHVRESRIFRKNSVGQIVECVAERRDSSGDEEEKQSSRQGSRDDEKVEEISTTEMRGGKRRTPSSAPLSETFSKLRESKLWRTSLAEVDEYDAAEEEYVVGNLVRNESTGRLTFEAKRERSVYDI